MRIVNPAIMAQATQPTQVKTALSARTRPDTTTPSPRHR